MGLHRVRHDLSDLAAAAACFWIFCSAAQTTVAQYLIVRIESSKEPESVPSMLDVFETAACLPSPFEVDDP